MSRAQRAHARKLRGGKRRACPACQSSFIKGRRVLLIERDYHSPEPSESIIAVSRVVCASCAKLAQPAPRLYLIPDQLEENTRAFMNAGKRQSDARTHVARTLNVSKRNAESAARAYGYPEGHGLTAAELDARVLDFARELDAEDRAYKVQP